jgi:uroporphyrinogen decarboxylase
MEVIMNSTERVRAAILGQPYDRQPIYGWVSANLGNEITEHWGSVGAFEDKYEFDVAHLFGGPGCFNGEVINGIAPMGSEELTPDLLVDQPIFLDPDIPEAYNGLRDALAYHKERGRFCYVQTPGFFEQFNGIFGIENQLMWLAVYPEELNELYRRQAEWTIRFADHCIDLGIDMIHISDDWGAQKDILFSPELWWRIIYPHMKRVVDHVHARGALCSLHSDGCVMKVADGIAKLGLDVVHPWQESAGMSYDTYLEKYADKFAILGGVCVQTAIGLLPRDRLEAEIRRVFGLLRGKRWMVCTTHFVQNHCSVEDLEFAYDLIYKLARE